MPFSVSMEKMREGWAQDFKLNRKYARMAKRIATLALQSERL